jgi:GR25 family glycosyltransferase involved in LPS biosynthesis
MLTIGITYNPTIDLYTSGSNQTSILLAELFKQLHNKVTFIDTTSSDIEWWPDFPVIDGISLIKLHQATNFDILIDIDGCINHSYHKNIACKTIVFLRNFLQFSEMDKSVYPESHYQYRNFENVSEIWCWDILNPPETIQSIQTLFSCPIKTVPFIWSPTVTTHFSKDSIINHTIDTHEWNIHIVEKNDINTSSSIIPLVAIRELHHKNIIKATYKCHNMDRIIKNKFLKENVLDNIDISKLPVEFVKKEPFYNFICESNSIIFSHTRFLPLRLSLINAVWMGIPLIHNSPILSDLHPELKRLFYFGNQISGICSAFKEFDSNSQTYYEALSEIRDAILKKWSIVNNVSAWKSICDVSFNKIEDVPLKLKSTNGKEIIIAFAELWEGFNWNDNFFTDALRQECKLNNLDISIKGVDYGAIDYRPDIIICGPFKNTSKNCKILTPFIPKIFFSAENWGIPKENTYDLHLTPYRIENEKHMRLPTWMIFIDWFNTSAGLDTIQKDDNPNRMPLRLAMNSHPKSFNDRTDFCGFVVSNPISKFRNDAFKALDSYKRVNSGGELYNNIGTRLSLKYPGGGCGDIPKYNFFSNHKFALSFENSQASGYITEKLLHSKMAGCVPLYWGDKDTDSDFVSGSFINVSQMTSPEQIVKVVQKLEENPEICSKIASTPILDEEKKQNALNIISKLSKRILELAGVNFSTDKVDNVSKIDKIFVVNLDTRKDRWDNLMASEPYLKNNVTRIPAINGKTLNLNNFIYKTFKDNKFFWKKSVIGCFLSHITIWTKIINEPGEYFLILEDDVRFNKDWINIWNKASEHIPKDAELLYLGGVLPPNKVALPSCLEEVNQYWSQIKPNTIFSPSVALPIFHFCTYSYIITKDAVKKLLAFLSNNSFISELDHFIGHPVVGLKKYILNPLITHCFQDEDPRYINSQFNDLTHTNNFDSDIWNNTESFTENEIDVFRNPTKSLTLYHIDNGVSYDLYEIKWIEEIFSTSLKFKPLLELSTLVPNNSWFIVQRPHLDTLTKYFSFLKDNNINFNVLHLSDEFGVDCIDFYTYSNCTAVIRNYIRDDIPKLQNIITVPLGFHHKGESSKTFYDRSIIWSFHGTNWFNRKELLEPLNSIVPHHCHFTDYWNDPKQSLENNYLGRLNNSKFCPILRGNNIETFRLYEALESGAIPIYVRTDGDTDFWNLISKKLNLIEIVSWNDAIKLIKQLLNEPETAEQYRLKLYKSWNNWKKIIKIDCYKLLINSL